MEQRVEHMVEKSIRKQALKDTDSRGKPTVEELQEIIDNYARTAAMVAAGFSLIPGPLGMILIYKELQTILQTQIDLVAHLTLRLHKKDVVTSELLMGMMTTLLGNVGISVAASQGERIILNALEREMAKHAAKKLSARFAQKAGYHVAAKWVPLAGSGLMYAHTLYATRKLGKRALHLLDKGIIIDAEAA